MFLSLQLAIEKCGQVFWVSNPRSDKHVWDFGCSRCLGVWVLQGLRFWFWFLGLGLGFFVLGFREEGQMILYEIGFLGVKLVFYENDFDECDF